MKKKIAALLMCALCIVSCLSMASFAEAEDDYLTTIGGTYVELFPELSKDEYRTIWIDATTPLVGAENAETATDMLLGMRMAEPYGKDAIDAYAADPDSMAFNCYFLGGVDKFVMDRHTIKGLDALDYLTALEVQRKNGTEYEDTNVTTISELLHSSLTVTDIPAKAIQENDYCVHVKLPKSFDVLNDELISGKLEDTGNYDACGSYRLLKGNDGCWYAVLRYDQNYIKQKEEAAAGADTSDAKVTSNVAFNFQWNQSEVTSSGFNLIEVNKDYALDITINPDETPDEDQKDDKNYDLNQSVEDPRYDGSDAYLDYTVTLVVQNEQAGPLTLADSMTLPTGVTAEYVEDSLQLSMKEDDTALRITWEDDNGERKITLGSAGSPIAAGTYSICYTVKLKDVGETAVDGVINNIKILDTPISDDAEESVKTDSLVITSQADPSDYELPSTGGAGTKLYTAGGGALMLAALVCGVCRKRRRERGAR